MQLLSLLSIIKAIVSIVGNFWKPLIGITQCFVFTLARTFVWVRSCFLMYSYLSTWQTTDLRTLLMSLLWVMVWIHPRSSFHPARVVQSFQLRVLPHIPSTPGKARGRMAQNSTSDIPYAFLLHTWTKLALRWLSTLVEKTPTRLKKKKKITPVFQVKSFLEKPPWTVNVWFMQSHSSLSLTVVLVFLVSPRLHRVSVATTETGKPLRTIQLLLCLLLERPRRPAHCAGWRQVDVGVTFEVHSSIHPSTGTHASQGDWVATQPLLPILSGPGGPAHIVAWDNPSKYSVNTGKKNHVWCQWVKTIFNI